MPVTRLNTIKSPKVTTQEPSEPLLLQVVAVAVTVQVIALPQALVASRKLKAKVVPAADAVARAHDMAV